jgi:hypothetical protein
MSDEQTETALNSMATLVPENVLLNQLREVGG